MIFALERRNGRIGLHWFDEDVAYSQKAECPCTLFNVYAPVATAFKRSSKPGQQRENRMSMPPPLELADLGPGIGIEQVVAIQPDALAIEQAPEIAEFRANEDMIAGSVSGPECVAGEPMRGLVHADHEMIRVQNGKVHGGQPDPAPGIKYEPGEAGRAPCGHGLFERPLVIVQYRFAKWTAAMSCDDRFQLFVRQGLSTVYWARIGVHLKLQLAIDTWRRQFRPVATLCLGRVPATRKRVRFSY